MLSSERVLLNLVVGDKSIGNPVRIKDHKAKMEWIKNICGWIDWSCANLIALLEDDNPKNEDLNFIDKYYNEYNQTKKNTPTLVKNMSDAFNIFLKFLTNTKCTHLVFLFEVYVPAIKSQFAIELIIDKLFMYGRTFVGFSHDKINKYHYNNTNNFNSFLVLEDNKLKSYIPHDDLLEYESKDDENVKELCEILYSTIKGSYNRCAILSNEEINIYAYSNCELI